MSDWETLLAAEGLAPLDGNRVPNGARHGEGERQAKTPAAIEAWQAWARSVLATHVFRSAQARVVWAAYAEGQTYAQIQAVIGKSKRRVSWEVAEVESTAPSPPCPNPWRRANPADREKSKVSPALKHYIAKRRRLGLKGVRTTNQALRLLIGGQMPKEPTTKPIPLLRYSRIVILGGRSVTLPGTRLEKTMLVRADGRPHAGGIDVYATEGNALAEVVTVPWAQIAQANRVPPAKEE